MTTFHRISTILRERTAAAFWILLSNIVIPFLLNPPVSAAVVTQSAVEPVVNSPDFDQGATTIRTRRALRETTPLSHGPASGWSFVLPSFVVHGIQPDPEAVVAMPRKLAASGDAVVTPGFGFQYEGSGGLLVLAAGFKDCYDNLAGTLQVGQSFRPLPRWSPTTRIGYSLGLYLRETPIACKTVRVGRSQYSDCQELDSFELKWLTKINNEFVDVIPMPFLHFSTALLKTGRSGDSGFELDFKLMSNFVLNEFGFAVPF